MPSDNRDRQLEKALARHLRSDTIDAACPDAETLAAYHERTLSLEEMGQWKQHIAACSRCQETLALVEESNDLQGSEEENRKMMELARTTSGAAAVSQMQVEEAVPMAIPVPRGTASKQTPKRAASLRWVVPVGALAAGLLVWVAVRETRQNQAMKSSQVQVAENRQSTPNLPAASAPVPAQNSSNRDETTAARTRALDEALKQSTSALLTKPSSSLEKKSSTAGAAPVLAIPMPDKEKDQAESQAVNDLAESKTAPGPPPPSEVSNYVAQNRELPPTQYAQAPSAAANGAAANQKTDTGRLLRQQNQVAKPQTQTTEAREVAVTGGALSQSMNDVLPEGGTIIVAPNDAYSWRVSSNGRIEHSTDNSRTWMLQKSGVATDLTAGSATSGKVCWVVGKAGTVLLTTDRGKHWKQLTSPTKEDLGGVNAVDDKRASIWTVSHSKSFETNDGGATWAPVGVK